MQCKFNHDLLFTQLILADITKQPKKNTFREQETKKNSVMVQGYPKQQLKITKQSTKLQKEL